jgi:hypothetical protein
MLDSESGLSGSEYVVKFNPAVAWTLAYDDSLGRLIFVFEIGDTPQNINLDPTPLENDRIVVVRDPATRARVDLAFERTKAFLVNCGYQVNVCGRWSEREV